MKYLIAISFVGFTLSACADLDDFLFNEDGSIEQYYLDDYEGEVSPELPAGEYVIDDNMINLFTLDSEGHEIHAVYIGNPGQISRDTVILYCHGNRDHMDYYWNRAKLLSHISDKHQYGVMMFDYRGFGRSEGKPTEQGMYEDAYAAVQWLYEQGLESSRFVVYGFSLGSAPATHLAAFPGVLQPSALILENPFASSEVMIQDASGLAIPASFFTSHEINNAEIIKSVDQPFLWMHGVNDNFLRIESHGEIVYRNYSGESGTAIRVKNAGHSGVPEELGFEDYLLVLEQFLRHR